MLFIPVFRHDRRGQVTAGVDSVRVTAQCMQLRLLSDLQSKLTGLYAVDDVPVDFVDF